ncbi:MAG TPA: type III-B CRISPR module-associated protein Cmr5 [Deltaproteobacteria bacterium]|nr:type III-B CRISPR module-associated protein Cmr5 [Deltaproteobacteria bacterium]
MIRDHVRARDAHNHAITIRDQHRDGVRAYGAHCHRLPILVHQAGLAAALHHTAALKPEKAWLLDHLAEQLETAELIGGKDREALLGAIRDAGLAETWQLTREVMRCLDWYRRFAHSVLKVRTSDEEDGGDHP